MRAPVKFLLFGSILFLASASLFAAGQKMGIATAPAEFDWLVMYDHSYQDIANEDNPLFEYIQEKFGLKVNLMHYHYDTFQQQRDVIVASGDIPDLMAAWGLDLPKYGARLIQPYNDFLAQGKLPNFKKLLEKNPGAQATLTEADGMMYVFPRFRGYPHIRKAPVLRLDLMKKGGFTGNTDVMDFAQFKSALQAMSKALDGEPAWLMRDGFPDFIREVPKAFGINVSGGGGNYPVSWNYEKGEYELMTRMPELLVMITALKDLYNEKLLHPDFHSMAEDVWERFWNDGKIGLTFEWSAWALNTPPKIQKGWDLQFGAILKRPDGKTGHMITEDPINLTWGDLLSKDSDQKDKILEFIDWCFGEEGAYFMNLGIEGLHYEKDSRYPSGMKFYHVNYDGLPNEEFDKIFEQSIPYKKYGMNSYREHGFQGWFNFLDPEIKFADFYTAGPGQTFSKDMIDRHETFNANGWMLAPLPLLKFTEAEAEQQADLLTPIQTYVDENVLKFILGTRSLVQYPMFVAEVEKLNADALLKLYNTAAARWKKAAGK